MQKLVVMGAGAMGLAAAYEALKRGAPDVTVIEADNVPGGMAAHFDFEGISIERFYHFICKADEPTFALMHELGIADRLRWRETRMGFFMGGRLHRWGTPLALLRFPEISVIDRLRYALMAFMATRRRSCDDLENRTARDWLEAWVGRRCYAKMWAPLMHLKFYELADEISAAWMWTRIKRVGTSRKSMFAEELGYIDGGSETLVSALVDAIEARGGTLRLGTRAEEVVVDDGAVTGVRLANGETVPADAVISTVPTPFVPGLVPALPKDWRHCYEAIRNIPVACVVMKLKRPVSENFWVNISDPDIEIPGLIEFSNLRPLPRPIVYVPYYMPANNPKWSWDDDALIREAWGYVRRINPDLAADDLIAARVGRLKHAQPVCEAGFKAKIPPVQTPIAGLQIADTCFYYPEDRGIAESVRLGAEMAAVATSSRREGTR